MSPTLLFMIISEGACFQWNSKEEAVSCMQWKVCLIFEFGVLNLASVSGKYLVSADTK